MQLTAERRLSGLVLIATALLTGAICMIPIQFLPYALLAAAGLGILAVWSVRGHLLTVTLLWFVAVICFDEEFWRVNIPFFFNVTISRLMIVVLVVLWLMMLVVGRAGLRSAGWIYRLMATMLIFFTLSAAISGFESISVATVHYRLIGGYWFAFTIFFMVLHSLNTERDILRLMKFFLLVGVYLTFTGWCEHLRIWSLVFPNYISDPTLGIHFGRVRGPFLVSPTMGLTLVFCFFNNLVLARQLRGPGKYMIYAVCILMLPPIFWTQTRSVWLELILGGMVYIVYSMRNWRRIVAVCLLSAAAILAFTINVENLSSQDRTRGGVADLNPIKMRIGLALITWDIFKDHPFTGVGFGHFRDVAPSYARNVDSPYYTFASNAMEHNNFLSILAETGIIGLLLYLVLLLAFIRCSIRIYHRLPENAPGPIGRGVLVLFWVLIVAYIVDGMFRETSVHPFTNSLFFGIGGMVVALDFLIGRGLLPDRITGFQAAGVEEVKPEGSAGQE
ncbi:MAG: O-antigen ligase family protein [Planctomycetota bacterium]|jgi:O-antigen ligase